MYNIVFHVSGLDCNDLDDSKIAGFYVAVVVEAADETTAVNVAHRMLIDCDRYLSMFPQGKHPNAIIEVDSLTFLEEVDETIQGDEVSGFIFYPPDDQTEDNSVTTEPLAKLFTQ